ncbi:FAD-dependent oxidoreductase [Desulfovibrio sp. OttesenSCG-928-A18]|nr:FAD-dependent oxidoreductase [Desulfovibrio sp. OttesenSCG-928-A18]
MPHNRFHSPVLVIGSGLAGCIAALCLADRQIPVTLLSAARDVQNSNSWLAQGGIIYKSGKSGDTAALEVDIVKAGRNLNLLDAVSFLAEEGPKAVEELLVQRLTVPFDRQGKARPAMPEEGPLPPLPEQVTRAKAVEPVAGAAQTDGVAPGEDDARKHAAASESAPWDLTREGGHSANRILHCADHTGRSIMEQLVRAVEEHPGISFLKGRTAVDLLTSHHHTSRLTYRYQLENQCCGAYVFNEESGEVETMLADVTVLATGGAGQVYLHSSNSQTAIGSGITMASRALVRLVNMEYMQFHPTTLFHTEPRRVLITEALRGEGARLVNAAGERFMSGRHPDGDLAPRDIVARCIVDELLRTGEPCVFLDVSTVPFDLEERFPTVLYSCLERGIDIRRQPIPVVPAAHYFCGGILVDRQGKTSLSRLYAVGECSCTGVHGANRLASTSLLEALLWGKSAAEDIASRMREGLPAHARLHEDIQDWHPLGDEHNDDPALIAQDWATIRNTMWNYVGITRTGSRLSRAFEDLRDLSRHIHTFYRSTPLSRPIIDLFHGCQTAYLITQAALRNTRDIGCHHRI